MARLDGKVAFVTGVGSGIGKATALLFAKAAFVARRQDEYEQTLNEIKTLGGEGLFIKADVSNTEEVNWSVKNG